MSRGKPAIEWEEPPPRTRYDWEGIAEELRRRPYQWAEVFDRDRTSLATAIRINGITALRRDKGYEVRTANNDRGVVGESPRTCTLYLRYVPENDTERGQ